MKNDELNLLNDVFRKTAVEAVMDYDRNTIAAMTKWGQSPIFNDDVWSLDENDSAKKMLDTLEAGDITTLTDENLLRIMGGFSDNLDSVEAKIRVICKRELRRRDKDRRLEVERQEREFYAAIPNFGMF